MVTEVIKKKPRGRPFQKGNTAGQLRKRVTPEEREVNKLTRKAFTSVATKYLQFTTSQLKAVATDPATPILDLMVASVINKALMDGDERKLGWFLEQLFGKLKEVREVTVSAEVTATSSRVDVTKLTDTQLKQLKRITEKAEVKSIEQ